MEFYICICIYGYTHNHICTYTYYIYSTYMAYSICFIYMLILIYYPGLWSHFSSPKLKWDEPYIICFFVMLRIDHFKKYEDLDLNPIWKITRLVALTDAYYLHTRNFRKDSASWCFMLNQGSEVFIAHKPNC